MHPLPEDPEHLTREMLTEAFSHLKKYQRDNRIYCRHGIEPETEFLLNLCGKDY